MTKIRLFGKNGCAKCKTTRNKLAHFLSEWKLEGVEMQFHDLETVDGLAEGAFYDVGSAIPVVLVEKDGRQAGRWDGEVPNSQAVRMVL